LTVVGSTSTDGSSDTSEPAIPEPPRCLGDRGRSFWDAVRGDRDFDDPSQVELLLQVCAALDQLDRERSHQQVAEA
jgi:hypothetical protein